MISLLAGSIPVSLDASGGRDHLEFSLDLSFTSGRVRIGNGIFEIWESEESPHYTGFRSLIKTRDSWEGETGYFSGMMAHAVSLAENPDLPSESDLDDGFAVLVTIRDILRRSRQSGLFRLFGL